MSFAHLHVHTMYSLLDGAGRIDRMLDACKAQGMEHIAITDHGVLYGVVDFYKQAKERGLHPILGCEVYVAPGSRFSKTSQDKEYAHLVLLAENETGYHNLIKLSSFGFLEGFYYKPRIDYELLAQYAEGLIGLSACIAGDIPQLLLQGRLQDAEEMALRLRDIFGEGNFFLELQDHGLAEQRQVNPLLIQLSNKTGIPLVVTNDVHYVEQQDAAAHEVLLCIQTGKTMQDENRMRMQTEEFYLKSPEQMAALFPQIPEAAANTVRIAERCQVEMEFGKLHLPEFQVEGDPYDYLLHLCRQGLAERYPEADSAVLERMDYELGVIRQMGYVDYFLIVWDFIRFAREQGIVVGPGRGSAAGSIVAYLLHITNIDPLKYQLLFERFLNPERISMPDIDIDFCYERRGEVIDYVIGKYGADRVTQIITFGTMAARAVIRDVGRALAIPYGDVDRVAKMIPMELNMTIDKALAVNGELRTLIEDDEQVAHLIEIGKRLEGLPRHASTHAAGVVISKRPVMEYVPLQKNDEAVTTQFPMTTIEELGLLKMDFLGLRTLTVIRDALAFIKQNHGVELDIDHIDMDDPEVYAMISRAETDGVFQLESGGMRQFLKELQPSCFEDIIAGISLYRPGPMDAIPRYVEGKKHPERVTYAHPILESILSVTYGCMVYQEQVMQIVRDMAGYSMGRSDLVRRAMAKKKAAVMNQERAYFVNGLVEDGQIVVPGAVRNGIDAKLADQIFDQMIDFASYAFNKSHAAAYGVVAYQTAYLKYHYPVEFMAATMNSMMGDSAKIAGYIQYCKKHDIDVLPPDINRSQVRFTAEGRTIRFGMGAVKNAGVQAVEAIVQARGDQPFTDFFEFFRRINLEQVNRRVVESLVKAGAFDSLGETRQTLLGAVEQAMDSIAQDKKRNVAGQVSLFELGGEAEKAQQQLVKLKQLPEFPPDVLLAMEREMTGVYISGHPLDGVRDLLEQLPANTLMIAQAAEEEVPGGLRDGDKIELGGMIAHRKTKTTKSNTLMAFVDVEDLYGQVEVIVFPRIFSQSRALLEEASLVRIRGRLSVREDEAPKVVAEEVLPLEAGSAPRRRVPASARADCEPTEPARGEPGGAPHAADGPAAPKGKLFLRYAQDGVRAFEKVKSLLEMYPGDTPIVVYCADVNQSFKVDGRWWITPSDTLIEELQVRLGVENVKLR